MCPQSSVYIGATSICVLSVRVQQQVCIQSVTVVLDEDVSRQITLTREGEVIIGANLVPVLPYFDGRGCNMTIVDSIAYNKHL